MAKTNKQDKINRAAEAFNAEQDKLEQTGEGSDDLAEVKAFYEESKAALVVAEDAKDKSGNHIIRFLIACATAGMTMPQIQAFHQADKDWPKDENGNPVGQKAARKSAAGKHFNSCSTVASRHKVGTDGVLELAKDEESGKTGLVKVIKASITVAKMTETAPIQPEQETVAHWQSIADALSPEQFDQLREHFKALGMNESHVIAPRKAA